MGRKQTGLPNLDKYLKGRERKLITYDQGAKLYGVPFYSFVRLAKEADANFLAKQVAIAELDLIEAYMDENPDVVERIHRLQEEK